MNDMVHTHHALMYFENVLYPLQWVHHIASHRSVTSQENRKEKDDNIITIVTFIVLKMKGKPTFV